MDNKINFTQWFESSLVVGRMPDDYFDINKYDYIINVSDEYMPYRPNLVFWFPMNECKKDIGLNSIYGALTILEKAYNKNRTVYLHCHAGINRSQTVKCAFHYMMTETHFEQEYGIYKNVMFRNCAYGYLPDIKEMEAFLKMFKDANGNHCSLDRLKLKTIK
jgi:hypothetical protein